MSIKFRQVRGSYWKHRNEKIGTKRISYDVYISPFETPIEISRHFTFTGAKIKGMITKVRTNRAVELLIKMQVLYRRENDNTNKEFICKTCYTRQLEYMLNGNRIDYCGNCGTEVDSTNDEA